MLGLRSSRRIVRSEKHSVERPPGVQLPFKDSSARSATAEGDFCFFGNQE
jgi:hypothetical protein